MGIKHEAVKQPGDRGFSREWNADHIIDGNVDFNKKQAINLAIENKNTWPPGPVVGQVIYRTDLKAGYIWNGTTWENFTKSLRTSTLVIAAYNSKDKLRADYVCDGVGDQVEINQAINDLPTSGGKIILLEGNYNLSASINITKSNVTIEGQGPGTNLNTSVDGLTFFTASNKNRITIRDMCFISTAEDTYIASLTNCNYIRIEEIWISGTYLDIVINGGRGHIIRAISTETWSLNLIVNNCQNVLIQNIVMYETTEDYPRIIVQNSSRVAITNCRIKTIDLYATASRCSVTNCICRYIYDAGTGNVLVGNITGA